MIPRFGRVFPLIVAVIGMIDARYSWHISKDLSIFCIGLVVYLIYFMFMDHASVSPKRAVFHLVMPFLVMIMILVATWFIFF